jgi:uncharacterized protein YcnI
VVVALLLGAGSAMAHVEVLIEPAQAGARDAVVTFAAEAESDSAGISSVQVQLPDGIAPGDVTLATGPTGWALTPSVDGYTVAGPPLPVGAELGYAITVKQLPNTESVAFKTAQSYTDGTTDRWIGLPGPDGAQPENPAPVVTLAPAAGALPPSSDPESASSPATAGAQPPDPAGGGGLPMVLWVGLGVVVVAGLVFVVMRRRASGNADG